MILRAHFYTGYSPYVRLWSEHPGHLNVRGVLRHCVPNKGLHPLRCESRYSHNVKGVTTKCGHAFYLFYCLTNTPLKPRGECYSVMVISPFAAGSSRMISPTAGTVMCPE